VYQFEGVSAAYQRLNVSRETVRLTVVDAAREAGMPVRGTPRPVYSPSRPKAPPDPARVVPINAISALFAIGIGIVHASLASVLAVGDVRPNLILAFVIAVTALLGLGAGSVWAFLGGLSANLLTSDPLGSLPLGLLLAAVAVAGLGRLVERPPVASVLLGGFSGSLLVDLTALAVVAFSGGAAIAISPGSLATLLLPTALVNSLLAGAVWFGLRALLGRVGHEPTGA